MKHLPLQLSAALLGSVMILGIGCRKPEMAKAPDTTKTDASADAAAKARAEEDARRQAEAARQAEQARLDAAKRAQQEQLEAYKRAAEKALVDVHFDLDKSDITDQAKPVLQGIAAFMKAYPQAKIQVEGNCDERGTSEYNLSLGERRANAVKEYLLGLGVEGGRLTSTSYGKEKPICTEHEEACWWRNRRAHFQLQ